MIRLISIIKIAFWFFRKERTKRSTDRHWTSRNNETWLKTHGVKCQMKLNLGNWYRRWNLVLEIWGNSYRNTSFVSVDDFWNIVSYADLYWKATNLSPELVLRHLTGKKSLLKEWSTQHFYNKSCFLEMSHIWLCYIVKPIVPKHHPSKIFVLLFF